MGKAAELDEATGRVLGNPKAALFKELAVRKAFEARNWQYVVRDGRMADLLESADVRKDFDAIGTLKPYEKR
jgi:hypothetical protein